MINNLLNQKLINLHWCVAWKYSEHPGITPFLVFQCKSLRVASFRLADHIFTCRAFVSED